MNRLERVIDSRFPSAALRLRLLKKRLHSDWTLRIARELVGAGDVVVDIGANRGVYAAALARYVGSQGVVHAIDPFPVNVRSLERLRQSHPNVVVHALALSDQQGTAQMYVPVHAGRRIDALASLVGPPQVPHDVVGVEVQTLDALLLANGATAASFVKCDVEGHEDGVLRGGRRSLRSSLPTLFVEIEQRHRREPIAETLDELMSWGYVGHALTRRGLIPLSAFDVDRDQIRHLPDGFVPYEMPPDYVGDFLFTRPDVPLEGLMREDGAT